MFNLITFDTEIDDLIEKGREQQAEERMLQAYSELKAERKVQELEHVVCRLAHFYSMPGRENLPKAEAYFIEREELSPTSYTKYQTAAFYFFVLGDSIQTIKKVDEISPSEIDRSSYYSALCLKGQALIRSERFSEAETVITELLRLIRAKPQGLPYGDEINLLERAISISALAPRCRELLKLIIPKIRSEEFKGKATSILARSEPKTS